MPPDDIDYAAIEAEQMPPPPPVVNLVSDDEALPRNPITDEVNLLEDEAPVVEIEPDTHSHADNGISTATPGIEPVTPQGKDKVNGQLGQDVGKSNISSDSRPPTARKLLLGDAPSDEVMAVEFEQLTQPIPVLETEQVTQPHDTPSPQKKAAGTDGTNTVHADELDEDVFETITQDVTQDNPGARSDDISPFIPDPLDHELPPLFPEIPPEEEGAIGQELETTQASPEKEPVKRKPRAIAPRDQEEDKILPQVPNVAEKNLLESNDENDEDDYIPETPNTPDTPATPTTPDDSAPIRRKRRGRPERRLRDESEESDALESDPESSPVGVLRREVKKKRKSISILSSDDESIKEVRVTPTGKRRKRRTDDYASEFEDAVLEDSPEAGRFYWQKTPGTRRRSRRIANENNNTDNSDDVPADQVVDVDALPVNNTRKRKRPARPGRKRQMPRVQREEEEDVSDDGPNWLDYESPKKKKRKRRAVRANYDSDDSDDEDRVLLSRRKRRNTRTRKRAIISDADDEDDVRQRRKRKRAKVRRQNDDRSLGKSGPYGYKKDGFVVSDNSDSESSASPTVSRDDPSDGGSDYSGPDGEYSEESDDEDPLWASRNKQVKKALKGKRPPFPSAMVCAICKWAGLPALGTPGNGWRDGYVMPGSNFSNNVKKGMYGVRMRKPYCLQHTAGDQNSYIERLELTAEQNKAQYSSESSSDDDNDSIQMNTKSKRAPLQISDDDDEDVSLENHKKSTRNSNSNNVTYCDVVTNPQVLSIHDVAAEGEDSADADVVREMNPENVQLSVEKTWLQSSSKDVQEITMHGGQWDWEREKYFIPPGKNIRPLRRFVVPE